MSNNDVKPVTDEELHHLLNESHEHFVQALLKDDLQLIGYSYANYVMALSLLLGKKRSKEIKKKKS